MGVASMSTPPASEARRPIMSAASLFRTAEAVATRLATLTLIAGLPLAAVTFAIKTF
jgi:hypothetical protein